MTRNDAHRRLSRDRAVHDHRAQPDGEDIQPIVAERVSLGVTLVRVLGMCHTIARFHPQDYGDRYYAALPEFARVVGAAGAREEE